MVPPYSDESWKAKAQRLADQAMSVSPSVYHADQTTSISSPKPTSMREYTLLKANQDKPPPHIDKVPTQRNLFEQTSEHPLPDRPPLPDAPDLTSAIHRITDMADKPKYLPHLKLIHEGFQILSNKATLAPQRPDLRQYLLRPIPAPMQIALCHCLANCIYTPRWYDTHTQQAVTDEMTDLETHDPANQYLQMDYSADRWTPFRGSGSLENTLTTMLTDQRIPRVLTFPTQWIRDFVHNIPEHPKIDQQLRYHIQHPLSPTRLPAERRAYTIFQQRHDASQLASARFIGPEYTRKIIYQLQHIADI